MNRTFSSVNTLADCTNTPSSADVPTSFSIVWMSLIVAESWLTHCTGSVCSWSLSSTSTPPTKITTLATARGRANDCGSEPSLTVSRPSTPSRKSRPCVGERCSRMPSVASGITIELRQMTAMPTTSSSPKARIIGTLAK